MVYERAVASRVLRSPTGASAKRLALRVLIVYVALLIAPFPLDLIPGVEAVVGAVYGGFWEAIVPWLGRHVLGIEAPIVRRLSGSGDTLFHYVECFARALLAVLGALVWSALARRRGAGGEARALLWLRLAARYYLASTMLSYGFAKLFKLQFPQPSLARLIEPIGDASPMGLMWTFMGYSAPYTIFTGALEVLAGLLLLSRRLTLAGSLVTAGVMVNVVMLNLSYDVAVKLWSLHLLGIAALLAAPDRARLYALLVSGAPAPAGAEDRPLESPRGRRRLRVFGVALSIYLLFIHAALNAALISEYGDGRPTPPLYGLYEVEGFTMDGEERPPLLTDAERWRYVIFDRNGNLSTVGMDGARRGYTLAVDEEAGTLTLKPAPRWRGELEDPTEEPPPPPDETYVLKYTCSSDRAVRIEGAIAGRDYALRLTLVPRERFTLVRRGFRWVQEYPFNR